MSPAFEKRSTASRGAAGELIDRLQRDVRISSDDGARACSAARVLARALTGERPHRLQADHRRPIFSPPRTCITPPAILACGAARREPAHLRIRIGRGAAEHGLVRTPRRRSAPASPGAGPARPSRDPPRWRGSARVRARRAVGRRQQTRACAGPRRGVGQRRRPCAAAPPLRGLGHRQPIGHAGRFGPPDRASAAGHGRSSRHPCTAAGRWFPRSRRGRSDRLPRQDGPRGSASSDAGDRRVGGGRRRLVRPPLAACAMALAASARISGSDWFRTGTMSAISSGRSSCPSALTAMRTVWGSALRTPGRIMARSAAWARDDPRPGRIARRAALTSERPRAPAAAERQKTAAGRHQRRAELRQGAGGGREAWTVRWLTEAGEPSASRPQPQPRSPPCRPRSATAASRGSRPSSRASAA